MSRGKGKVADIPIQTYEALVILMDAVMDQRGISSDEAEADDLVYAAIVAGAVFKNSV